MWRKHCWCETDPSPVITSQWAAQTECVVLGRCGKNGGRGESSIAWIHSALKKFEMKFDLEKVWTGLFVCFLEYRIPN